MGYYNSQILTYIGNKRKLLPYIEEVILDVKKELKTPLVIADLFSGSGVVARMMKSYAEMLVVNDLETYSRITNECYLTNRSDFNVPEYLKHRRAMFDFIGKNKIEGIITNNYAPKDDSNIKSNERAFYTRENAIRIDTVRAFIDTIDSEMQKFFLAPLLYEASVHTNTSGVFKGFYKDNATGIGKFGGSGENALKRIKGKITIPEPMFSPNECEVIVHQEDANALVKRLGDIDIAYLDPPYNQHPYGSNYFMLNVIAENRIDANNISKVSGIPKDWNRSNYNNKNSSLSSFNDLLSNLNAKYVIVSYNSEGFIDYNTIEKMLMNYGVVTAKSIKYNTFRGSRNLKDRSKYVDEYLFVLKKER